MYIKKLKLRILEIQIYYVLIEFIFSYNSSITLPSKNFFILMKIINRICRHK